MADVITHSQVVPEIVGFGDFESITGGDPNLAPTEYYEPGARTPRPIYGTGKFNPATVTRAFIPGRDNQLVEWWRNRLAGVDTVPRRLVKKFRNVLGVVESTQTFQVHVTDVKTPDGKAGDNTVAEIQVTLYVEALL